MKNFTRQYIADFFFHFVILDMLQNLQGNYLKWPLSICEFLPYFNS